MPFLFANDLQNWDDAIEKTQKETFRVETFAEGFDIPWGMAFLPNKDLIVSDRNGNLWRIKHKSKIKNKISGVPKVRYKGQGGLLDIETHPDFINNTSSRHGVSQQWIYGKNLSNRRFLVFENGRLSSM